MIPHLLDLFVQIRVLTFHFEGQLREFWQMVSPASSQIRISALGSSFPGVIGYFHPFSERVSLRNEETSSTDHSLLVLRHVAHCAAALESVGLHTRGARLRFQVNVRRSSNQNGTGRLTSPSGRAPVVVSGGKIGNGGDTDEKNRSDSHTRPS